MKYTKWIIAILTIACFSFGQLAAQTSSAIDKYFKQYVDDDRFTVVYISPTLSQTFKNLDVDGIDFGDDEEAEAIMEIAKNLEGLRILTTEENAAEFYKEAKSKIDTKEYEVLLTVKEKDGDNVEFLVKREGEKVINELLLLAGGDEFALISFVGKIDLDQISKLANAMDDDDDDDDNDRERNRDRNRENRK